MGALLQFLAILHGRFANQLLKLATEEVDVFVTQRFGDLAHSKVAAFKISASFDHFTIDQELFRSLAGLEGELSVEVRARHALKPHRNE